MAFLPPAGLCLDGKSSIFRLRVAVSAAETARDKDFLKGNPRSLRVSFVIF